MGFAVATRAALPAVAAATVEAPTTLAAGTALASLQDAPLAAVVVPAATAPGPATAVVAASIAVVVPTPLVDAIVPLQVVLFFFFLFSFPPLFLIFLPLLFDGVKLDGPWRPIFNVGGVDLLVRGTSVWRMRTATRPITDSDGVAHSP